MTLRVIVQIVPFGDEEKAREIGRLDINNIGALSGWGPVPHEYQVIDLTKGQEGKFTETVLHVRQNGAWALVRNALDLMFP